MDECGGPDWALAWDEYFDDDEAANIRAISVDSSGANNLKLTAWVEKVHV